MTRTTWWRRWWSWMSKQQNRQWKKWSCDAKHSTLFADCNQNEKQALIKWRQSNDCGFDGSYERKKSYCGQIKTEEELNNNKETASRKSGSSRRCLQHGGGNRCDRRKATTNESTWTKRSRTSEDNGRGEWWLKFEIGPGNWNKHRHNRRRRQRRGTTGPKRSLEQNKLEHTNRAFCSVKSSTTTVVMGNVKLFLAFTKRTFRYISKVLRNKHERNKKQKRKKKKEKGKKEW